MNAPIKRRMRVPEFLAWAEAQPEGRRYELVDGVVVGMSPERARHVRSKVATVRALQDAIHSAGLTCEAFGDGMTVVIDEHTSREPDALVQCGKSIDPDSLVADSPVIVVEILSPSNERSDTGEKLAEYFPVESVRHYLIVNPFRRLVIHHARGESGQIDTRIVADGVLELGPPGLSIPVALLLD